MSGVDAPNLYNNLEFQFSFSETNGLNHSTTVIPKHLPMQLLMGKAMNIIR